MKRWNLFHDGPWRKPSDTELALAEASQRIEALQAQLAERDKELHDTTLAWAAAADDRDEANGLREAAEAKVEALTAANTELRKLLRAARERERSDSQDVQDELAEARAEGRPSWQPRVEALIAKWRNEAALKDRFHATMGIGWKVCADELSALLAPEQPKEETP